MNITYSNHAKIQKVKRDIHDEEVSDCLSQWDTRHTDKKGNPVFRKTLNSGRGIKVVVAKDNEWYIITVADY